MRVDNKLLIQRYSSFIVRVRTTSFITRLFGLFYFGGRKRKEIEGVSQVDFDNLIINIGSVYLIIS